MISIMMREKRNGDGEEGMSQWAYTFWGREAIQNVGGAKGRYS